MTRVSRWAHVGYLGACEAALQSFGVEIAAVDAGDEGLRTGSIEALVLGSRGRVELLDLGWTEEHGWGYSRKAEDFPAAETYTHGQFGGEVLPEPDRFAGLVVRIAAGEELADHVPGEPLRYRSAADDDGFAEGLLAYDPAGTDRAGR
ncbi:hypothetical protein ACRYCC_18325 [Actinomadura scrupuli]|uniref:hypothetical protein n=1 Tax=Actinomadura scrupuli TaxID=559629 RepID=UPI003D9A0445